MSIPPAGLTMKTGRFDERSTMIPTYASVAISAAGVTSTLFTVSPLICMPRIFDATSRASDGVFASFTPPALPRPPACTCALTTTVLPNRRANASASVGVFATSPTGTGMP
jgi:hypothetical protein